MIRFLTRYFLNLVYLGAMLLFSPWLIFAAVTKGKYREGFAAKFFGMAPPFLPLDGSPERKRVWIHAVSVGEVNLIAPILKGLRERFPNFEFVISSTSKTGFHLAQKKYAECPVFYAPLDFTWSVKRAFRRLNPDILLLVELEIWPNLLWEAQRRGVPVVVFNGRLSDRSFRGYRRVGYLMRQVMQTLALVLVQDETSGEHFRQLGVASGRIHSVGSLKYEGAETDRQNARTQQMRALWGLAEDARVFLAGSTQAPEESLALKTFLELAPVYPQLRLILVPRHPERFDEVAALLDKSGFAWTRRSQLGGEVPCPAAEKILLVDTVGELGAWWGVADIGFVGGSLQNTRGGQNMIEAAAFGSAVSFGPMRPRHRDARPAGRRTSCPSAARWNRCRRA